jgi:hypothetical protein
VQASGGARGASVNDYGRPSLVAHGHGEVKESRYIGSPESTESFESGTDDQKYGGFEEIKRDLYQNLHPIAHPDSLPGPNGIET